VLLGDSVLANVVVYQGKKIHECIEEKTGLTVFNGAFGGTSMAINQSETMALCNSNWCMANLASAISDDDWKAVRASMSYADFYKESNRQVLDGYKQKMEMLSNIDFSKVKVLIIEHGTNDYNSGIPLDNSEDLYDKFTFGGALRSVLSDLTTRFPNLKIVILTPAYCEVGMSEENGCDVMDWGGGLLYQYVEKELEIATEFGVDVIDMYHESPIDKETVWDYTSDGLHPNAVGIKLWENAISEYLKGLKYED
jgi:lysophospholipase L1-like esterase